MPGRYTSPHSPNKNQSSPPKVSLPLLPLLPPPLLPPPLLPPPLLPLPSLLPPLERPEFSPILLEAPRAAPRAASPGRGA